MRSRESSISHGSDRCAACGSGRGRVGRGQCVEASGSQGQREGHVMESSRSTLVGLEVFLVRALVVGWWRAMHSSAALMSECVRSWGPARASLLWSRVRGATGGREPPSPSAARRPDARCISTHGYHRPCTTSTRRTPWTWPKRPTRGREVFWLLVLQRHPQPASKRASAARLPARGGGARSAAAIAPPGGARGAAPRVCVC